MAERACSCIQASLCEYLLLIFVLLVGQVGPKKAREMWFLTRFYTASEAERMGLVNTVVPVSSSIAKWNMSN